MIRVATPTRQTRYRDREATSTADPVLTSQWVRNESDRIAVANGCWFDAARGAFAVWWIERYCKLYEGEWAGEPLILRSGNVELDQQISADWYSAKGRQLSLDRAASYIDWLNDGNSPDWQYECTMRVFGWTRSSEQWGRPIRRFNAAQIWVPKKQKKALALNTPIPTPSGWTTVSDIRIGDVLFDVKGKQCQVVDKTDTYCNRECYRVHFSNGESVVCDAGHLWVTSSLKNEVVRKRNNKVTSRIRPFATRTTEDIFRTQRTSQGSCVHTLKMPNPIDCDETSLPIDPYLMGFWLGDGDSDGARVTFAASDERQVREVLGAVCIKVREAKQSHGKDTVLRAGIGTRFGKLRTNLRKVGVLENKHIPPVYLRASVSQRTALLQGLMDTDGHCAPKSNMLIFATSNERLRDGFAELLASLGIKFSCNYYGCKKYWRFQFMAFRDQVECFRFERKRDLQPYSHDRKWNRSRTVQIVRVEQVASVPVQCIAIDSPTREFLFGKTMLPTHNTPTMASWSVYLTCGDGEQGAKVFAGAKDGQQARLQMDHAIAMVEQSPELAIECKINKNEASISHLPTRSKFSPMSSSNAQTEKTKEGLNGSLMIDEVHVVDRSFIRRISRMGISRSEPLRGELSTVGNDPESYGKERQDYGRQVLAGSEKNDRMFVAIYEAPQDLSHESLAEDPIKYGKIANPAWGHTAYDEEYLSDYHESKRTILALADFLMYRLNIWQRVANAWLNGADWEACEDGWDMQDFRKHETSIGLDLSKTRDMSAITATIRDAKKFRQKTWLFTTETFVEKNADKANFKQWVKDGHLIQIPGDTIKNSFLKEVFDEVSKILKIKCLVYDKTFAHDFVEWCDENYQAVECVEFPQSYDTMARPIDDYEAAVIDREVFHDVNPCLNWQAGNCMVKESAKGGLLLTKPSRGDVRKIDGMVTSVMSFWGATALNIKPSVYQRRGVITI